MKHTKNAEKMIQTATGVLASPERTAKLWSCCV